MKGAGNPIRLFLSSVCSFLNNIACQLARLSYFLSVSTFCLFEINK